VRLDQLQQNPDSVFIPFYKGNPLLQNQDPAFLTMDAQSLIPKSSENEAGNNVPMIFLGCKPGANHNSSLGTAYFAFDVSDIKTTDGKPLFQDFGSYQPLRNSGAFLQPDDLAILGHARWLLHWHYRHRYCANCGAQSQIIEGGTKRKCANCQMEHFPRTDPVAIILPTHDNACLLGRSPHFAPGFLSALAGFVEANETIEECALREVYEEVGVTIHNLRYLFSQPWPFPGSLMMGFLADAQDRQLNLDLEEIEEARWIEKDKIIALLEGEENSDFLLPPSFTIAHQLIKYWAYE